MLLDFLLFGLFLGTALPRRLVAVYPAKISLFNVCTINDIINEFKLSLIKLFEDNNLINLKKIVEKKHFHIRV